MQSIDTSTIITTLLVILCVLASLDLWRQYSINNEDYWYYQYTQAVKSKDRDGKNKFWQIGYHIEDLEDILSQQYEIWHRVRSSLEKVHAPSILRNVDEKKAKHDLELIRMSRNVIHEILTNDSAVYHIHCKSYDGPLLRVGENDFRTDSRDSCQIFDSTSSTTSVPGPHNMFERISLTEGEFALRSVGSRLFMKAVPPPPDNSGLPWKLVVGSPVAGIAERFRLTDDGYLYSSLVGGFFQCEGDKMIKGFPGKYGTYSKFLFEKVSDTDNAEAQKLVHLSNQIISIQTEYAESNQKSLQSRQSAVNLANSASSPNTVKICIGVPMTSRGTVMQDVDESPFWPNLFDSFMKSIDWLSNKYVYRFYLGFDKGDSIYDTGDAWSNIREEFRQRATYRMIEQLIDESTIKEVLETKLTLKLMHFDHLEGAPTQVVSQLMLSAYVDNFDYFYQVNDDTVIITPNWTPKLIEKLASNPFLANFGVTGPSDTNNNHIFTHSFTHRTHLDVFGHLFPPSFKNWWSDDWISTVYGSDHTFLCPEVEIKHNVATQKEKGFTRYEVDKSAQLKLDEELLRGHVMIDEWLKKNSHPRLPLPNICGYIPLTRYIAPHLLKKNIDENIFEAIQS